MKSFPILAAISLVGILSCKARGPNSKVKDQTAEGPCQLIGQNEIADPVAKIASTSCNTNVEKMFYDAGCKSEGRAMVAEKTFAQGARAIDVFNCPADGSAENPGRPGTLPNRSGLPPAAGNQVFFAHPNEMLTFSDKTQVINFYKFEEGNLQFKGNSFSADNPCRKCHVMGGMVMKEISSPWVNWLDPEGFNASQPEDVKFLGTDRNGVARKPFVAPVMEEAVRTAAVKVAEAYKKSLISGSPTFQNLTLQDVLKPLFCTVEVNLANSILPSEDESEFDHLEFAIVPLYLDFFARSGMSGNPRRAPSPRHQKSESLLCDPQFLVKKLSCNYPGGGGNAVNLYSKLFYVHGSSGCATIGREAVWRRKIARERR